MTPTIQGVPKRIWFLWLQGLDAAPMLVRSCWESWKFHHPGWDVTVLTEANVEGYIRIDLPAARRATLSCNHLSNLIRLKLLLQNGGIWADATTFCMRPLETWIGDYLSTGLFAFRNPGPDRILSSWFLASRPGHRLVAAWHDAWLAYWLDHDLDNHGKMWLVRLLRPFFNSSVDATRAWFSPIITKTLRIYPYFFLHYIFAELVRTNPECAALWRATPHFPAAIPHKIQHAGMLDPPSRSLQHAIDRKTDPLYKLTWKFSSDMFRRGCALDYLLQSLSRLESRQCSPLPASAAH